MKKFDVQEARETIRKFGELLFDIPEIYQEHYDTVGRCDRLTVDITHDIEFTDFNMKEGYKKAKALKNVKIERRQTKELMEFISVLKTFSEKHQDAIADLKDVISQFDTIIEEQKKRVYIPRENKQIESAGQHFEQELEKQLRSSD